MIVRELLLSENRMSVNLLLLTSLLGENRVIVSDIAGTTRDAVDTEVVT